MLCVIVQPPQLPTFIGFSSHHLRLKSLKDVCISTQRQNRSLDDKCSTAGLWMLIASALTRLQARSRLFQCDDTVSRYGEHSGLLASSSLVSKSRALHCTCRPCGFF